jgi:hypothetical protein
MITITGIGSKHGYSGYDHLIDDSPLQDLLGQQFRSVRDLHKAVTKTQFETADKRVRYVPVAVEIVLATGDRRTVEV